MEKPGFCSSARRAGRWWRRCAAPSRSTANRGAGASCSAAAWRAISAGRHPPVSMPISTPATPERRRLELADAFFHGRKAREFVLAADRPARVPQIETRARAHRVLLRGGERRQRADVAPVGALLELLHPRNVVLREVVREDLLGLADARQEVAAEVHLAAAARLFQQAAEHLRLEKI